MSADTRSLNWVRTWGAAMMPAESFNDIGGGAWFARPEQSVRAVDLIGAMRQMVDRAHPHGIRVIAATLLPTGGTADRGYDTPESEATRTAVNDWIRWRGAVDALLVFDQLTRDAAHPERMQARFDSGDHLHPGDAGYAAMAEAFDVAACGN